MMEDKHYEVLGRVIRKMALREDNDLAIGKLIMMAIKQTLKEAERDAREAKNK
jgi:hypothetical protein